MYILHSTTRTWYYFVFIFIVGVVTLSLPSAPPNRKLFVADHPFIYILRKRLNQERPNYHRAPEDTGNIVFTQTNDQKPVPPPAPGAYNPGFNVFPQNSNRRPNFNTQRRTRASVVNSTYKINSIILFVGRYVNKN